MIKKKKINFNHAEAYVLQAYELIMFVVKRQSQVVVVETNVNFLVESSIWAHSRQQILFLFPFLFFFFVFCFYLIRTKNIYIKYACTRITKGSDLLGLVD